MSYEKIQSLKITKDGTISMRCANSKQEKLHYTRQTIERLESESVGDVLKFIFEHLANRNWRFNPSNNSRVCYCFYQALRDVERRHDIIIDVHCVREDVKRSAVHFNAYRKEVFEAFQMRYLNNDQVPLSDNSYGLRLPSGAWFKRGGRFGYKYSFVKPKPFKMNAALIHQHEYGGEIQKLPSS